MCRLPKPSSPRRMQPRTVPSCMQDGAHEMCRLPKSSSPRRMQTRTVPSCMRSLPGTQYDTARRLYVSSLANFRSSVRPQIRGSAQGCALPPMRQGWRFWRAPRSPEQALERLVCSAS